MRKANRNEKNDRSMDDAAASRQTGGASMGERVRTMLLCALLAVLGVAMVCQPRWTSSALQSDGLFGGEYGGSFAAGLGCVALIIAAIAAKVRARENAVHWPNALRMIEVVWIAAMGVSTLCAGDVRLALNTSMGLIVGLAAMHAMRYLIDRPWKARLVVLTIVSLGVLFATKTWVMDRVELEETWQHYCENRQAQWAAQGKSLDDPTVLLYEARLKSRDNGGFLFHSNLGGTFLVVTMLTALAAVTMRLREPAMPLQMVWAVAMAMLAAFIASAVLITYSKGAIASMALGVGIAFVFIALGGRFAVHPKRWMIFACVAMAAATMAIVVYGLKHDTLPSLSMAVRWEYWRASLPMFADHWLVGVGPGNFGQHYLAYKLPRAEEEVLSPHNWPVQTFSEFGIVGGAAATLWPIAFLWAMGLAAAKSRTSKDVPAIANKNETSIHVGSALAAVGVPMFLTLLLFTGDVVLFVVQYLWYVLLFPIAIVIGSLRGQQLERIEDRVDDSGRWFDGRTNAFLAAALLAFIVGEIVNFSLFEMPTQLLFFMLCGLLASTTQRRETISSTNVPMTSRRSLDAWAWSALAAVMLVEVTIPTVVGERIVNMAREPQSMSDARNDRTYLELMNLADWPLCRFDGHVSAAAAKRLLDVASKGCSDPIAAMMQAADDFAEASRRSPNDAGAVRGQAQCEAMIASAPNLDAAARTDHWRRATELYGRAVALTPRSRSMTMQAGLTAFRFAESLPAGDERRRAMVQSRDWLTLAMSLNEALKADSLRRFPVRQREEIERTLKAIGEELGR